MQSKTIIVVGHEASLTGAPKSLLLISKILINGGYKVVFVIEKDGPGLNNYTKLGVTYIWNKDISNANIFTRIMYRIKGGKKNHEKTIYKKIKHLKPFLIFNNTIVTGNIISYLSNLNIPIISRIPELESVIQYYNNFNNTSSIIINKSNKIIAVSDAVKNNLIENHKISKDKIDVIYGAIPKKEKTINKIDKKLFTVVACGTLIMRKGPDLFLNVARICINKIGEENIQFIWIGGDKTSLAYHEFKQDIQKLNIKNNLIITGETKNPEAYYQQADVFILTSREDPFPLVMIEAAQAGLPIIAFKNSGGAEEFIDNTMGVCVPYINTTEMANSIISLYNNKQLLANMSEGAYNKSLLYTTDNISDKLLKLIEQFV